MERNLLGQPVVYCDNCGKELDCGLTTLRSSMPAAAGPRTTQHRLCASCVRAVLSSYALSTNFDPESLWFLVDLGPKQSLTVGPPLSLLCGEGPLYLDSLT